MATPWAKESAEVLSDLGTDAGGLSAAEASKRLAEHGPNRLPEPPKTPWYVKLWGHMNDVLILVLLTSAIIKFALQSWVDAFVILGVVFITMAIGMIQEGRAEKSLNAIKNMLSLNALTLRNGEWSEVDASTLVPGDVVRVKAGDRAPADARLIESSNLEVEEAALTGESVAAVKTTDVLDENIGLGDRTNMLFSSTIVVQGTGTAVITGTGANTEIGRIQDLIQSATDEETPLSRTMDKFGKKIAYLIIGLAGFMMLFGFFVHQMGWFHLISTAIGVAVAAIPEGLPAVVTIALALGVKALASRNSISRNLTSTETLGSVSTICSDKTGTLTQNEMTVRVVRTTDALYDVTGAGYAPSGEFQVDGATVEPSAAVRAMAETMVVCNDALIKQNEKNKAWELTGQPTDGGVLVFGYKTGFRGEGWNRIAEIPFDSATKYMAALAQDTEGNRHVLVKGALDQVMARCTTQQGVNGLEPVDAEFWLAEMEKMAKQGLRVLAAARMPAAADADTLPEEGPQGLILTGIVGIVDPPRPEAIESIREAKLASIDVKMITGDHVITAKAIAEEMGISDGTANALTGPELEAMSDEELAAVVRDVHVFARVSPEHKIRVVRALQTHGEIVAMTGDGVNDAPALTQANVGVAMGIKGTEATKAAADLILLDDNFSTIEKAIFEGRRIFDNIRKCTTFALSANVAQVTGILLATFIGWEFTPLEPVQVLWVNMVVAVFLDLTFASERAEPGVMRRKPRNQKDPLIGKKELVRLFSGGLTIAVPMIVLFWHEYFVYGTGTVESLPYAQSAAISMITLGTAAYVFNIRYLNRHSFTLEVFKGNKVLTYSLLALAVVHTVLLYTPMRHGFGLAPTSLRQWAMIVPAALGVFLLNELWKFISRKVEARKEFGLAA